MTQQNREAVSIDISQPLQKIDAAKGVKITSTNWRPGQGALEARQRVEQAIKEQHQREVEIREMDPTFARLRSLEKSFESVVERLVRMEESIAVTNATIKQLAEVKQ
jgi:hypothetical protein